MGSFTLRADGHDRTLGGVARPRAGELETGVNSSTAGEGRCSEKYGSFASVVNTGSSGSTDHTDTRDVLSGRGVDGASFVVTTGSNTVRVVGGRPFGFLYHAIFGRVSVQHHQIIPAKQPHISHDPTTTTAITQRMSQVTCCAGAG